MATATESTTTPRPSKIEPVPALHNGDRLSAAEFERLYRETPTKFKAELIEGVVYVASPVSNSHGSSHFDAAGWLLVYRASTPGIVGSDNGTIRLDLDNRPQPDLHLRITPEYGGRARLSEDDYVVGAPEFVLEASFSSASYDLHDKLNAYRRNEVQEYVVWRVENRAIDWFILRDGQYERLPITPEGHYRSEVLPGLWLDPKAMLDGDLGRVLAVLHLGLASPDHARFVADLRARIAPDRPAGEARP